MLSKDHCPVCNLRVANGDPERLEILGQAYHKPCHLHPKTGSKPKTPKNPAKKIRRVVITIPQLSFPKPNGKGLHDIEFPDKPSKPN